MAGTLTPVSQTTTSLVADSAASIEDHLTDLSNPHAVTKTQIGLGNADDTSDATKNAAVATLTNKTIALGSNTVSGTLAQLNTAITDAEIARTDAAQTFTGVQTFSSPVTVASAAASSDALRASDLNGFNSQLAGTSTLTTAEAKGAVTLNSASAFTVTLPSATSCAGWGAITLTNIGAGTVTVQRAGSDTIYSPSGQAQTSITLLAGESIRMFAVSSYWIATATSVAVVRGTWTPTLVGTASGTLGTTGAVYQRIGDWCFVQCSFVSTVNISNTTEGVANGIGGLPYSVGGAGIAVAQLIEHYGAPTYTQYQRLTNTTIVSLPVWTNKTNNLYLSLAYKVA